eukprot:TRINITY_DN5762_c0_g2_i1.p1 TRINITY_DN5762_c0_g2~~TRINITY_DN5762_c0_g2_i1.p1  ORF type:complete len:464 (+),score=101.48 TRINITY_DN5762_c0_g2_i1:54-1445(+)
MERSYLVEATDHVVVEIVSWLDMRSIANMLSVCRRFNQSGNVIHKLINRIIQSSCGIPNVVIQTDPARRRKAMQRLDNRVNIVRFPFAIAPRIIELPTYTENEQTQTQIISGVINPGDELMVHIPARPNVVFLGDEELNRTCPAILRDTKSLEFVGYLPNQHGFATHFHDSPNFGKFLVTVPENASHITATHIQSNMVRSTEELRQVDLKLVAKTKIFEADSSLRCGSFHRNWGFAATPTTGFVFTLDDAKSAEVGITATIHSSVTFPEGFDVFDGYLDCHMNVLVCISYDGEILVFKDLYALKPLSQIICKERLWPAGSLADFCWVDMYVKDGFLVVISNAGRILVFKWNEAQETYEDWVEFCDDSYNDYFHSGLGLFVNHSQPRLDVQCGLLVTVNASGLMLNVWDLLGKSTSPIHLLSGMEDIFDVPDHFPHFPGAVQWSNDGSSLIHSTPAGDLLQFDF